jgi:shikimate dehydrogenase
VYSARTAGLITELSARFSEGRTVASTDLAESVAEADELIHCTPTGMAKLPGLPLPAELLHPALWIAEFVYFPLEMELLRVARELGCQTLDGGGMAVFEAVRAFQLITGMNPMLNACAGASYRCRLKWVDWSSQAESPSGKSAEAV